MAVTCLKGVYLRVLCLWPWSSHYRPIVFCDTGSMKKSFNLT